MPNPDKTKKEFNYLDGSIGYLPEPAVTFLKTSNQMKVAHPKELSPILSDQLKALTKNGEIWTDITDAIDSYLKEGDLCIRGKNNTPYMVDEKKLDTIYNDSSKVAYFVDAKLALHQIHDLLAYEKSISKTGDSLSIWRKKSKADKAELMMDICLPANSMYWSKFYTPSPHFVEVCESKWRKLKHEEIVWEGDLVTREEHSPNMVLDDNDKPANDYGRFVKESESGITCAKLIEEMKDKGFRYIRIYCNLTVSRSHVKRKLILNKHHSCPLPLP